MKLAKERKIIYVIENTTDPQYKGWVKVGDASEPSPEVNNHPNSHDLRKYAAKRVRQYMTTAGLSFKIDWVELADSHVSNGYFRDYDVHNVLERSGFKRGEVNGVKNEWFKASPLDAIKAIHAVKNNQATIPHQTASNPINNHSTFQGFVNSTPPDFGGSTSTGPDSPSDNFVSGNPNPQPLKQNKSNKIRVIKSKPFIDHSTIFKSQIARGILGMVKDSRTKIDDPFDSNLLIFDALRALDRFCNLDYHNLNEKWIRAIDAYNGLDPEYPSFDTFGSDTDYKKHIDDRVLMDKLFHFQMKHNDYPVHMLFDKESFIPLTNDALKQLVSDYIKKIKKRVTYDENEKKEMKDSLEISVNNIDTWI